MSHWPPGMAIRPIQQWPGTAAAHPGPAEREGAPQMTTHPLRIAVGSHKAGSGQGCAMNIVSWENGDTVITDLPACADPMLARVVQVVNDTHCTHRDSKITDLLCPPCSLEVLALAHRTPGTNLAAAGWGEDAVRRVWVRLAVEEAVSVEHLCPDARVRECNATVLRWLDGKATEGEVWEERLAAYAVAYHDAYDDAADAAYFAAVTAASAIDPAALSAADAAGAAFDAASDAAAGRRIDRAHALIDRFEQHTGIRATPVAEETVLAAVGQMLAR